MYDFLTILCMFLSMSY